MSNKLVELLEAEGKRLLSDANLAMEATKKNTLQNMEAEIKSMVEALGIQPLTGAADVIELLEKGGIVKSKTFEFDYDNASVGVDVESRRWVGYPPNEVRLRKGKYRFTLIIEPVEEQP